MISLTGWIADTRTDCGVYFADDHDDWVRYDYAELARRSRRVAQRLRVEGITGNAVVCLVQPNGPTFVAALFGAWLAGAAVCPLATPTIFDDDNYLTQLSRLFAAAGPSAVITDALFLDRVRTALDRAGLSTLPVMLGAAVAEDENSGEADVRPPDSGADIALLQFTSGSTGRPRAVRVSQANLIANITMIRDWLKWGHDGCASWLPLHHDMGLIGCLITPVVSRTDLWLMRPDQFVRDPMRWLACFGDGRAALTAAPSFGFAYAARKLRDRTMDGMDLSGWRSAVVGAEPIDSRALNAFAALLHTAGFTPEVFRPAYGLAEATLAVSGLDIDRPPRLVRPDWSALRLAEPVSIVSDGTLGLRGADEQSADQLMSCGRPLPGNTISIVDSHGESLPDGSLGEIVISGPTVADGYHGDETAGSTRFAAGLLWSGDAGFLLDGELFVLGRIGDSLKVRGRNVFVEDLELKVSAATGLSHGRCVVVSGGWQSTSAVALLADSRPGPWVRTAIRVLRTEVGADPTIHVIVGGHELIRRSTSGKPRRRHMWEELLAGRLGGTLIASDTSGG
ncbi:AMP-binding protein [Nocardia sp. NPDC051321]|uniref:AMP-binding protein n=1 Tax=Nocardia sp. NPDC051321 TaxID=3364323 RepID=UPI00378CAA0E